jgi:hypothetical protein
MKPYHTLITEIGIQRGKQSEKAIATAMTKLLKQGKPLSQVAQSLRRADKVLTTLRTMKVESVDADIKTDFHKDIDAHLSNGEIVKPEYERLKSDIDKHIRDSTKELQSLFLNIPHDKRDDEGEEVYYAAPDNLHGLASFGKKISKLDQKHPIVQAAKKFYDDHIDLHNKMKALKDKVVTTAKKRDEVKAHKVAELKKKFTNSASLVNTLTKHRDDFVIEAKKRATEHFTRHLDLVKKAGGLDQIAPSPNSRMGRDEYRLARQKRDFYSNLLSKPLAYHVDEAGQSAHHSYMEWVAKITEKIGKSVIDSDMDGNPWIRSLIHVTCSDGAKQTWSTKMIINYSKYGKAFNQFPTRRVDKNEN